MSFQPEALSREPSRRSPEAAVLGKESSAMSLTGALAIRIPGGLGKEFSAKRFEPAVLEESSALRQ